MTKARKFDGQRTIITASIIGLTGLVLCGIGSSFEPRRAAFSWLMAFAFAVSIALGALIFLLIGYVINAKWVVVVRRLNECIALAVVPLAFAFVPILLQADQLYLWADPSHAELSKHEVHLLEHKEPYLNVPFFAVRAAIFFVVFIVVAGVLRRWSVRRDGEDPNSAADPFAAQGRFRILASATLPLVALCLTFAAFDWLMSLEPFWFSTMYGVYVFAGGFLGAIALMTVLGWLGSRDGSLPEVSRFHFHALGRLLFAFTIFWAYIAFFQAMLIQIANKPEEVTFYLRRIGQGWDYVVWTLVIGHFAIPFFLLLIRSIKFHGGVMAAVGGWLLLMHWLDTYWLVAPVLLPEGMALHWMDLTALMAIGGLSVAFVAWLQRGTALLPTGDPFLRAGLEYRSS